MTRVLPEVSVNYLASEPPLHKAPRSARARSDPRERAREDRVLARPAREPRSVGQLLVADPVRLEGVVAEALLLVGLVVGEVALEPGDLGVALEGEDVGGDAVEEPA